MLRNRSWRVWKPEKRLLYPRKLLFGNISCCETAYGGYGSRKSACCTLESNFPELRYALEQYNEGIGSAQRLWYPPWKFLRVNSLPQANVLAFRQTFSLSGKRSHFLKQQIQRLSDHQHQHKVAHALPDIPWQPTDPISQCVSGIYREINNCKQTAENKSEQT